MRRSPFVVVIALGLMAGCATSPGPTVRPTPPDENRQYLLEAGLPESMVVMYDSPPILQNGDEIDRLLRSEYPEESKRRGERGRIQTLLRVGLDGVVKETRPGQQSEFPALNEAAAEVVKHMRFSPALVAGQPTEVWIQMWVAFIVI